MEGRVVLFNLLSSGLLTHFVQTGSEFVFVNTKLTWTEAQTYCREKFTDMVTIYNDNDNLKLMSLTKNSPPDECVWTGLHHNIENWKWSNGVSTYYVNRTAGVWANFEPSNVNGNEYCAVLSAAKTLDDTDCSSKLNFVCFDGTAAEKYIMNPKIEDWSSAQDYCRKHYDDLSSISNQEDLDQLKLTLDQSGTYRAWIGLYRDPWNSWSDNGATNFTNWAIGQPYHHTTNDFCGCLSNSKGEWMDTPCNTSLPFFCYGEARRQTILKMKLQSDADINNREFQHQISEQMKSKLASMGSDVKWRVTMRKSTLVEPAIEENCTEEV